MYDCNICGKSYTYDTSLYKHKREKHNIKFKEIKIFQCFLCNAEFRRKKKFIFHMREHTNEKLRKKRLLCSMSECDEKVQNYASLRKHLVEVHGCDLKEEQQYEFEDVHKFKLWKTRVERELKTTYVQDTAGKRLKDNRKRCYYFCHWSQFPRLSKYKYEEEESEVKSINRACPSILITTITDQKISVQFYPTHIGHTCDNPVKVHTRRRKKKEAKSMCSSSSNTRRPSVDDAENVLADAETDLSSVNDFVPPELDLFDYREGIESKLELISGKNLRLNLDRKVIMSVNKRLDQIIEEMDNFEVNFTPDSNANNIGNSMEDQMELEPEENIIQEIECEFPSLIDLPFE